MATVRQTNSDTDEDDDREEPDRDGRSEQPFPSSMQSSDVFHRAADNRRTSPLPVDVSNPRSISTLHAVSQLHPLYFHGSFRYHFLHSNGRH